MTGIFAHSPYSSIISTTNGNSKDSNSSTSTTDKAGVTRPYASGVYGKRFPSSFLMMQARIQTRSQLAQEYKTAAKSNANRMQQQAIINKMNQLMDTSDAITKQRYEDCYRNDGTVRQALEKKVQFMLGRRTKTVLDVVDDLPWLEDLVKSNQDVLQRLKPQPLDFNQPKLPPTAGPMPTSGPTPNQPPTTTTTVTTDTNGQQQQLQQQQPADDQQLIQQDWTQQSEAEEEFPHLDVEALHNQALEIVMTQREYLDMKNEIDRIERTTRFHPMLYNTVLHSMVYGRAVLYVETGADDLPVALKLFNSQLLGYVKVDPNTWELDAVQYRDFEAPNDYVPSDEIIYLPNKDYNISPYSLYYGLSELEPILDDSETNRMMSSEDFKEIARSSWAARGFLHIDTKNDAEVANIVNALQPNLLVGTNMPIQYQEINLPNHLLNLLELRDRNKISILQALEVPSPLVPGFEMITNRSTLEKVLVAWKESHLSAKRTWLRDYMEPQWYDTLASKILNEKNIEDMKVKVKMEFVDITLEIFSEKAAALLPLYINGVIPLEKILESLDMEDVLEQMKIIQQQQERQKAQQRMMQIQQMKMLQQQQQQQQNNQGAPFGGNGNGGNGGSTPSGNPKTGYGTKQDVKNLQNQNPTSDQRAFTPKGSSVETLGQIESGGIYRSASSSSSVLTRERIEQLKLQILANLAKQTEEMS